ncbi:tRNA (guanine-N(1)-)-methyltransferase [Deinococcus cellulosilyticus NBRC 106333 = KACC 11606]|uniref:tRNA (guanine-N(1)-)-methyltransferase n=1 Tax=Deinococcus cellulosilyticus (strain DSM 18568 / NBRC 106333 / KACC 11606 / 5516J-15) TaxID=1223518 RepID=A0A511N6S5_DEIC1|nr:tRNA (guanine-N(1)-)-methyltransferase [Deinococcus cellulosilyticus NBRC 106333 = KACC 11606]
MKFSVVTLFPELVLPFTREAILGKAQEKGLLQFDVVNLREHAQNKHNKVDDTPYGGGAGMVIRVDVVDRCLQNLSPASEVIMLTPAGQPFNQKMAEELAQKEHLVVLCGRYEGFDARVETLVTREISLGDFVMMGGEAAAACLMEAIGRLVPGVIGDQESHEQDSFSSGLLDYPEYTRPESWQGLEVPEVLRSGNHAKLLRWRRDQALERTLKRRPDLLGQQVLDVDDTIALWRLGVPLEQLEKWGAPAAQAQKKIRRKGLVQNRPLEAAESSRLHT